MAKQEIIKYLEKALREVKKEQLLPYFKEPEIIVEIPPRPDFGDYASPLAIAVSKSIKKDSTEIAKLLKEEIIRISPPNFFSKIEVVPPGFLNFYLSEQAVKKFFDKLTKKGIKKGKKKNETIVIEYSSPNIAKPLGIHHIRSTVIGQALVNILRFAGYKVVSLSFPGDWGTQFGLLIAGYKRWGNPEKIEKDPINEMLRLYVKFSQAAQKNPQLLNEGKKEFKKLEEGDKENWKLWRWFLRESLRDFQRVYKLLAVKIEHTIGESFYEPELKALIKDALGRGIAQKGEDGSVVISLSGSSVPEIIQKSDGTTIFTTRELAAIRHRFKKWKASKIIYVAANQQTFHLNQVFHCAELLGFAKPGQLKHVKFGMMLDPTGKKFATREGRLIPLEEVLKEAVSRSLKVVEKLNPQLSLKEKKKIAEIVGIGALKYNDLSQNRLTDIRFDWDKMLNFEGNSAPYLQYSFARLQSILRKAKFKKANLPPNDLKKYNFSKEEILLLKHLFCFNETLEEISKNFFPNQLADYLYQLATKINNFYEKVPVLKSKEQEQRIRLSLIFLAAEILKTGLNLLGIEAPKKM